MGDAASTIEQSAGAPRAIAPAPTRSPAIVLDPFLGSGTTALVADRLGRDCIGLELSSGYAGMARRRTGLDAPRLRRAA